MPSIYPNLFVLLVSPPGVGKSVSINASTHFLKSTHKLSIAPTTATKAALVDTLKDSKRNLYGGPLGDLEYHSLVVPATEFGNLVPAYDLPVINFLNDLFDCREDFIERTRGGGEISIANPQISLLGGTQPDYLSVILPEAAWGMGFTSRIIMIYSADSSTSRKSLFSFSKPNPEDHKILAAELTRVAEMRGEFRWSPEAAQALDEWHMGGGLPAPKAPRLVHYVTRRTIHLVKLMCISALARHSMVIEMDDFHEAIDWLFEAEEHMPEIFRAMTLGGDAALLTDAAQWCQEEEARTGLLPEHLIIDFLRNRVKIGDTQKAFDVMVAAHLLLPKGLGDDGKPTYTANVPKPETSTRRKPKPPKSGDLFAPIPTSTEGLVPARYILRVTTDAEDDEIYDADFYEKHA